MATRFYGGCEHGRPAGGECEYCETCAHGVSLALDCAGCGRLHETVPAPKDQTAIAGLRTEQSHMEQLAEISFELLWIEAQGAAGDATAAARYVDVYQGAMLPAVKDAQRYFGRFADAYQYIIADYVALGQLYFADVVSGGH